VSAGGPSQRAEEPRRDPGGGLLVGRPFGVPIYVSPTWLIIAVLITVSFGPFVQSRIPSLGSLAYVVSFAFAVLLYVSVLVHELAHSVVALRFGLPVRRISLYLLGGVSEIEKEAPTPGREFLIAVAGPVLSLVLGGIGFAAVQALEPGTVVHLLVLEVAFANLLVGVFNLLPGLPLDGGRLVQAGVWKVTGRRLAGITVAAWTGRAVAVLILLMPILFVPLLGGRPDLLQVLWAALIAAFVWSGAGAALRSAQVRERLPALHVRSLTRRAIPVPGDQPLGEALRRLNEAGARGLVVVDSSGRPTALVSEAAVKATPEQRRPWVQVASLARSIEPGLVLQADLAGEELIDALRETPATEYLVVEPGGEVFGVLATTDIEQAFATRT
jgi:Zn-dependent protease/CBS domain-containing protein